MSHGSLERLASFDTIARTQERAAEPHRGKPNVVRMRQVSLPSCCERHGAPSELDGSSSIIRRQSGHREAEVAIEIHLVVGPLDDYALEAAARLRQLAAAEEHTTLHQQIRASRRAVCRCILLLEQPRESIQVVLRNVELLRITGLAEHHRDRGCADQAMQL